MHRNKLTTAICAILLLIAAPAAATNESGGQGGGNDGDGGGDKVMLLRPTLTLANGDRFRPSGIVINLSGSDGGAYHIELGEPVETRDEDKVDLGKIPLFGKLGIGQETTSSEFRGAIEIGAVYRYQDTVVVDPLPDTGFTGQVSTAYLSNQGRTFMIDTSIEKRETKIPLLGNIPVMGQLFRIGGAYRKNQSLLILVTPHLIKLDE